MVDDNVLEEGKYHDNIGLRVFYFCFLKMTRGWVVREILSEYPYLFMLMKL